MSHNAVPVATIKKSKRNKLAGLETYTGPWDKTQASHLLRRTHFGNKANNQNYLRSFADASSAVDAVIADAIATPLPDEPTWFKQGNSGNVLDVYDIQFRWMDRMYTGGLINSRGGLLEKMMLFWSNHFAVSYDNMNALPDKAGDSYASHMYKYFTLLHQKAFGNYKEFVYDMSINSAMLYYLNNFNNSAGQPNEDFARELLELFTLGPKDKNGNDNYTETDVAEVARAVTGWRVNDNTLSGFFDSSSHDNGQKTILGATDNFDLQGVIDRIYQVREQEAAWFLSQKLYVFFVSPEPDFTVINQLADHCVQVNFDIAEVLRKLLSSAHFYETQFYGCKIKSPIELFIAYLRELEIPPDNDLKEYIRVQMPQLNEELLRPETVFGWKGYNPPASDGEPGNYTWLNTNILPSRWDNLQDVIFAIDGATDNEFEPTALAEKISDPNDPFTLAVDLAEHMLALPLSKVDVREVEEDFAGDPRLAPDISSFPEYQVNLSKILLGNIPWYEWATDRNADGTRSFPEYIAQNVRQYISYLQQLPAYQLT